MLIDIKASNFFISRTVAEALWLKQTETKSFVVEVGNGQQVKSRGSCKEVQLWIDKLCITHDYFLFNLGMPVYCSVRVAGDFGGHSS